MGNWWVGAKKEATFRQTRLALAVIGGAWGQCDDVGKDQMVAYLKAHSRWHDAVFEARPDDHVLFDGGGVLGDEPKVAWEANGCKMKTHVRHLPWLLARLQGITPHPDFKGCAIFEGFFRVYVLSMKTVEESIPVIERLVRGTESLRQELEIELQAVFNNHPQQLVGLRQCGCASGLIYGDCCGKYVETRSARESRQSEAASTLLRQ